MILRNMFPYQRPLDSRILPPNVYGRPDLPIRVNHGLIMPLACDLDLEESPIVAAPWAR